MGLQAQCEWVCPTEESILFLVFMLLSLFFPPHLFPSTPFSPPFLPPGLWPVPSGVDYPSGFQGGLRGVSQRLRPGEGDSGLRCPCAGKAAPRTAPTHRRPLFSTLASRPSGPPVALQVAPTPRSPRSLSLEVSLSLPPMLWHHILHQTARPRVRDPGFACGDRGET